MTKLTRTAFLSSALLSMNLAGAADLTVRIDDVKSATGVLMVAVYSSADTFLKKPLTGATAKAVQGANTLVIKDLPEGEYAYAVYHDLNLNGKMDSNMMGIPTEDYAFSNNALGKMGPPSYDNAKFVLPAAGANTRVSVK